MSGDANNPDVPLPEGYDHLSRFKSSDVDVLPSENEKGYFAPSAPVVGPVFDKGVQWRGPWENPSDGTAVATRLHALALERAGFPVQLYASGSFLEPLPGRAGTSTSLDAGVVAQVGHLRHTHIREIVAQVHHMVPSYEGLLRALYPSRTDALDKELVERMHGRKVAFIVLERDRIDARSAEMLAKFGQVWVPCHRNRAVLVKAGIPDDKVHVVPHPYDEASPMIPIAQTPMMPGPFTFLAIGKWEPRKNLDAVIGGFLRAFTPDDDARMVLKTSGFARVPGYPESATASARTWLEDSSVKANGWNIDNINSKLLIISSTLSYADLCKLYRGAHAFVSASHGEAFDLPTFDACLAGIPIVHVGFGGSEDYAPPSSVQLWHPPNGPLEDVHLMYNWPRSKWAAVGPDQVAAGLSSMCADDNRRRVPFDSAPYSPYVVGKQMADLLGRLS